MGTAGPDGVNTSVTSCGEMPPSDPPDAVALDVDVDVVLEAVVDGSSVVAVADSVCVSVLVLLMSVGVASDESVDVVELLASLLAGSEDVIVAVASTGSAESVGLELSGVSSAKNSSDSGPSARSSAKNSRLETAS